MKKFVMCKKLLSFALKLMLSTIKTKATLFPYFFTGRVTAITVCRVCEVSYYLHCNKKKVFTNKTLVLQRRKYLSLTCIFIFKDLKIKVKITSSKKKILKFNMHLYFVLSHKVS